MEVEAKLAAPSCEVLDAIAARDEIGGLRAEPRPAQELETVYLDTRGRALRDARAAVRLRRSREGIELTVKRAGESSGDVARRREWTIPLPSFPELPWKGNPELLAELGDIRLDGALEPLVATLVRRRPLDLRGGGGTLVAEVDLDEVRFRRAAEAETSGPSWEVEIELRDGEESEISRLAAELRRHYPLEPTRLSKLERALRWAGVDR
jgi:triphosphatase